MLNGSKNRGKKIPIFVLVGVNHRLTRSTKVYVYWEGKTIGNE